MAVRSSAKAEDLAEASFAGQQDTYLGVVGTAGVLFTHDPITGDADMMLASSSYGLGESVVAARVTPDTFRLSRNPAAVLGREIGSKQTRIDPTTGGGTITTDVPDAERVRSSITDAELLRLVDLGERGARRITARARTSSGLSQVRTCTCCRLGRSRPAPR